jgi:hypothetical protein
MVNIDRHLSIFVALSFGFSAIFVMLDHHAILQTFTEFATYTLDVELEPSIFALSSFYFASLHFSVALMLEM